MGNWALNILTSSIVAGLMTFWLNMRERNRRYKKLLLDDLMGHMHEITEEYSGDSEGFIVALNRIFVVYNSDKKVIKALSEYKNNQYKVNDLVTLIKEMCKAVGIKYDSINDEFLMRPFSSTKSKK